MMSPVLDGAPIGCYTVDDRGVIAAANTELHRLLGRAPGTLSGYRASDVGLAGAAEIGRDRPEPAAGDMTCEHPDGSERVLNVEERGVTPDGRAVCWVRDVTDTRRIERALDEARGQVQRANRLETLGTVAGGLAHDLNNVLAPILGLVELVQLDLPSDAAAQSDLQAVRTAARRASDLAQQVLRLARAERDELVAVRPARIAREVLTLIEPMAGSTVTLGTRIDDSCPPVLGTETQLHQVLLNLCRNALQAMPGGGDLSVAVDYADALATWVERPPGDGPFVRIRVADTGAGIAQENLDRIFDPLFTTKPEGAGSGLGLAMVRRIIDALDGTISVSSEPGAGTVFTLLFPPYRDEPNG